MAGPVPTFRSTMKIAPCPLAKWALQSPGIDLRVELASAAQLVTTIDQIRSMVDVLDICRTGIG